MSQDVEPVDYSMVLRTRLICWAAKLKRMTDTYLRQAQRVYKPGYDKTFRFEPALAPEDYIFFACPSLSAAAGDWFSAENCMRLSLSRLGLYRTICVVPEVVRIMRVGINNIFYISRMTHATHPKRPGKQMVSAKITREMTGVMKKSAQL